jgi:AraC family transcriptional regulator, regulatory protein of adaptative response / DNA-3-methyladenine glycosylase II
VYGGPCWLRGTLLDQPQAGWNTKSSNTRAIPDHVCGTRVRRTSSENTDMSENGEHRAVLLFYVAVMLLDPGACYQAMQARDARFDGRFFVGVASTKIYCRPVCRVRMPLQRNCTFYPTAAAAEHAGFRPCLKCRPELAPGRSMMDGTCMLARAAAQHIDASAGMEVTPEQIALRLGVTSRHLRRIFMVEFGVTPISYLQTHRLLLSKRLLTDTTMPITEVAYASGFRSLRRMHALYARRYRFSPGRVRAAAGEREHDDTAAFEFTLAYRPPYQWQELLQFLGTRALHGMEAVIDNTFMRALSLQVRDRNTHKVRTVTDWVSVGDSPEHAQLRVRIGPALAPAIPQVLAIVRRVFDVAADPAKIAESLGDLAAPNTGLRLPGAWDGFELAVRAILGQQVTVRAARTVATRLVQTFGPKLALTGTMCAKCTHGFPTAAHLARVDVAEIARLGMPISRARAIRDLASAVVSGQVDLSATADVERLVTQLRAIKGVGQWTAQYTAMRALSWPDAWLPRDVALLRALGLTNTLTDERAAQARAESWRPWRSYAVIHLWHSLAGTVA